MVLSHKSVNKKLFLIWKKKNSSFFLWYNLKEQLKLYSSKVEGIAVFIEKENNAITKKIG